jgi:hypothetical protein
MRSQFTVPFVVVATLTAGLGTMTTRGQTPEAPRKLAVVELFTSHG